MKTEKKERIEGLKTEKKERIEGLKTEKKERIEGLKTEARKLDRLMTGLVNSCQGVVAGVYSAQFMDMLWHWRRYKSCWCRNY